MYIYSLKDVRESDGVHHYLNGGLAPLRNITTANQLRHNGVKFAKLCILILDGWAWTLIQCNQHELGWDT